MNEQHARRKNRGNRGHSETLNARFWTAPRVVGVFVVNVMLVVTCTLLITPASGAPTGGSGGAFTDQTFQSFTASNGLSSQYHSYAAGLSRTTALCAVFQFHGDGAYEFKNPASSYSLGGATGIVAASRARGCITVPVLTPDKVGSLTWWENGSANAVFARDLTNKMKSTYNIDTTRIWLVGYSGGAQFISQFFLPQYSSIIEGGGAVVFGGGGSPYSGTQRPYSTGLISGFHMHWYTGANDNGSNGGYNALRDAKAGEAGYAAKGFRTSHEYPTATAHALDGRFGGVLDRQLKLYDKVVVTGATPTSVPSPTTPSPTTPSPTRPYPTTSPTTTARAPAAWNHHVTPYKTGATLTVDVPPGTSRTTFRVSAAPIKTQTGFYLFTSRTGLGISLNLSPPLSSGRLYYYQVEVGTGRSVVASGTFRTLA